MAINCKVQLSGNLGQDPKTVTKGDKTFMALRVATTDSYPVTNEQTGEVTWKDKDTLWHDVLVFRTGTINVVKELVKGDAVEISASISYRPFKDEAGNTKMQASLIANFIQKIEYSKDEALLDEVEA